MIKKSRLKALINLLDDPDNLIFKTVEKELLKQNHTIIPALEERWESIYDETAQERIENLIQSLQFKKTKKMLHAWITSEAGDLLDGFLIVNRVQFPDVSHSHVIQKTEKIRNEVWLELNNSLTILEKVTILNHFFFNIHGFSVNHENPKSPQNCYLNQLLDTKKGTAVSLSLLYTIIARQLDLPAQLTDFPKNPLVAMVDRDLAKKVHGKTANSEVLFYINPANKGSVASRKEILYHLKKNNYHPPEKFAEPQPDKLFIQRLIESLNDSFQSIGFSEKSSHTGEMLNLFKK